MGHALRIFSRPRARTVETSQTTFQFRSLLRPGSSLNRLTVGALAKAQELYPIEIHAFAMLSTHWHLLATYTDPEQMASFHRHFSSCLSNEVGLLHRWSGTVFPRRYHHVELSDEPEIELARLKYITGQGCKEGLCASPLDWPGVTSTESLISGEPMKGVWIDRTALSKARRRGESVTEADFAEHKEIRLTPLRSLAHLSRNAYRRIVLDLIRDIENETAAMHAEKGTRPLGIQAVLSRDPHHQPESVPKSPRPWFFALKKETRQAIRTALLLITVAYREAAGHLKAGERDVTFPEHTFPPHLPFIKTIELLEPG